MSIRLKRSLLILLYFIVWIISAIVGIILTAICVANDLSLFWGTLVVFSFMIFPGYWMSLIYFKINKLKNDIDNAKIK